jgi:hypothetical protein
VLPLEEPSEDEELSEDDELSEDEELSGEDESPEPGSFFREPRP